MKITVLTLFPEYFQTPLNTSILKRAQAKDLVEFKVVNIRDFAKDKHQVTDDRPFGGGPGMVMKVEPIDEALAFLREKQGSSHVVLTSAKGRPFSQEVAQTYATLPSLTIICGHYEGVDERVAENLVDDEVRIGEFVLTGGEPAAVVMIDAITRLLPGVLGNEASNKNESHSVPGQLGYSQYTRPEEYKGWKVPAVLLSGDHQQIEEWRKSEQKTENGRL